MAKIKFTIVCAECGVKQNVYDDGENDLDLYTSPARGTVTITCECGNTIEFV